MKRDNLPSGPPSGIRRSLSQIALAFATVGFLFGVLVMSPDGRFAGFVIMTACAAVPLALGPRRYRVYGAAAALISVIGIVSLYGDFQSSPYRVRANVRAVYQLGSRYCAASGSYRERTHVWPGGFGDLNAPAAPAAIRSVSMGTEGAITLVLSFRPLENRSFTFVPVQDAAAVRWECSSSDIPEIYLPFECRRK